MFKITIRTAFHVSLHSSRWLKYWYIDLSSGSDPRVQQGKRPEPSKAVICINRNILFTGVQRRFFIGSWPFTVRLLKDYINW